MVTVKREFSSSDSELSPAPSDLEDEEGGGETTTSKYFNSSSTVDAASKNVRQSSRKRKREDSTTSQASKPPAPPARASRRAVKKEESPNVKEEDTEQVAIKREGSKNRSGSKNNAGGGGGKTKLKKFSPPANWRVQYDAIKELRLRIPAVVDTMGCERLAEPESDNITPKDQRFQTLMALVLSSQTKDTVTSAAIKRMQKEMPGGLKVQSMLKLDEKQIDDYIKQVGFHNKKSVYIKKICQILVDSYGGDIPDTIDGMTSLPGVGPKMSYLCMAVAWKRVEGIGVDTHVHRIANLLKWVPNTPNPETTRAYLESWLPKELWHEINWLLVGFGQTICLPRGRRCWECTLGPKSTGGLGICRAAVLPDNIKRRVKQELAEEKREGNIRSEDADVKPQVKIEPDDREIKTEVKVEEISAVMDLLPAAVKMEEEEEEEEGVGDAVGRIADIEDVVEEKKQSSVVIHEKRTRRSNKRG